VIVYQVSPLTYRIARYLSETEYVGLVNVLAEKEIVPELLQNNFTVSKVTEIAVRLLQDEDYRATMISQLKSTRTKLGEAGAYDKAGRCIENVLSREPAI
jgi:lipid-A-disaccharide synthase